MTGFIQSLEEALQRIRGPGGDAARSDCGTDDGLPPFEALLPLLKFSNVAYRRREPSWLTLEEDASRKFDLIRWGGAGPFEPDHRRHAWHAINRTLGKRAAAALLVILDAEATMAKLPGDPWHTALDQARDIHSGALTLREHAAKVLDRHRLLEAPDPGVSERFLLPSVAALTQLLCLVEPDPFGRYDEAPRDWMALARAVRCSLLLGRDIQRHAWIAACDGLGFHAAITTAILATARQTLEIVPEVAGDLERALLESDPGPHDLAAEAASLLEQAREAASGAVSAMLEPSLPPLEHVQELNRFPPYDHPTCCHPTNYNWLILADQLRRPAPRYGAPSQSAWRRSCELIGRPATAIVCLIHLKRNETYSERCSADFLLDCAARAARAGCLDLHSIVRAEVRALSPGKEDVPGRLDPLPSIVEIRRLLPRFTWADEGWDRIIRECRSLAENFFGLPRERWPYFQPDRGSKRATAAFLMAVERPGMARRAELAAFVEGVARNYPWYNPAIESERAPLRDLVQRIDAGIEAAAAPDLARPVTKQTHPTTEQLVILGIPAIQSLASLYDRKLLDWHTLSAAARMLATGTLGISPEAWTKACETVGPVAATTAVFRFAARREHLSFDAPFRALIDEEANYPGSALSALHRDIDTRLNRTGPNRYPPDGFDTDLEEALDT